MKEDKVLILTEDLIILKGTVLEQFTNKSRYFAFGPPVHFDTGYGAQLDAGKGSRIGIAVEPDIIVDMPETFRYDIREEDEKTETTEQDNNRTKKSK